MTDPQPAPAYRDCGEQAPRGAGPCVRLIDHGNWHRTEDGIEWIASAPDGLAVADRIRQEHAELNERLGRVTAERDELRAELASDEAELARLAHELEEALAELAQADEFGRGEFGVTTWAYEQATKALTVRNAERAADLADLRAAAQDLHDLGEACAGPIRREADAYELAASRVERVIARINHRAGETPDAD